MLDWSENNTHPFLSCPACNGLVDEVSYEPLAKTCRDCGKTYQVIRPMVFEAHRHNVADSQAYLLHDAGLSWTAVGIVMRTYHNIELGPSAWRNRIKMRYRQVRAA